MRVAFATLGCKVNHFETEAMRALFEKAGWDVVAFSDAADVYVVNTCTVTSVSDGKSRQLLSRAHRKNPDALVVAAGCYAQVESQRVAALPGVGLVLGNTNRAGIVEAVEKALRRQADQPEETAAVNAVSPLRHARIFEPMDAARDGRTRATLKIQDGCTNFCSYCIIPYARGPLRSRPLADTRAQMEALVGEGYKEIVLTGIHLASYGRDLGCCDLLDVLAAAKDIPGLARVRLGSLEPKFVDERFVAAVMENDRVCRQFHLSLQSGSDAVLKRMNRRYTKAEYARAAALIRQAMPDSALTTDVIAGFCGETEAEHAESMAFVRDMAFARIHVFPFSLRRGTKAADMPDQLPQEVKEARARELIRLGKALTHDFLTAQLGKEAEVLIEHDGAGYTGNYVRVQTETAHSEGALVRVKLCTLHDETISAEEVKV